MKFLLGRKNITAQLNKYSKLGQSQSCETGHVLRSGRSATLYYSELTALGHAAASAHSLAGDSRFIL